MAESTPESAVPIKRIAVNATAFGPDSFTLYALDSGSVVWSRAFTKDAWGPWQRSGVFSVDMPAVIWTSSLTPNFVMACLGTPGAAVTSEPPAPGADVYLYKQNGPTWNLWTHLPGPLNSAAAVTFVEGYHDLAYLYLFGLDTAGYVRWFSVGKDGTRVGWFLLGGGVKGTPAVAGWGVDYRSTIWARMFLFINGSQGIMMRDYFHDLGAAYEEAGWGAWSALEGPIGLRRPAVAVKQAEQFDLFVQDVGDYIRHKSYRNGVWSPATDWDNLGQMFTDVRVAPVWRANGNLDVMACDRDGRLWWKNFNGTRWGEWQLENAWPVSG
ncbi:MAG TPA: hypothetical protein VGI83_03450 [Gemmatimonadales bacterium]|jgi:hypothetical protein